MEILGARTETAQTFARPEGGYTTEESTEPRWARGADGAWTPVDLTLEVSAQGVVVPRASVLPVEFSGGGSGPVARLRDGDREVALTWPGGALPEPVLSGTAVTYPEVLPGVDLRFTASALGFSQVLVVKTREAAEHPVLDAVRFDLAASGVSVSESGAGGLVAQDPAGEVVFTSPVPVMWDSGPTPTPTPTQARAAVAESGEPRRVAMPVSVEDGQLTVVPDSAMLADPGTTYPVYIDPSWTGRIRDNAWTTVLERSDVAGTSFWQNNNALTHSDLKGGAGAGRTCDSISVSNTCLSAQYRVRSFFRMDLSQVQGTVIYGASLRLQQQWTWTCNPSSNAGVWLTNDISPATTWNNQPWWDDAWTASAPANHRADAAYGCLGSGDVEFDVTHMVRRGVQNQWSFLTMGLRAWDEGTVNQWKRFDAATPVLAIDYNTPANTPDSLTADGRACATGAGRPFVPTATPTLRARVSDNDAADGLLARFDVARVREDGSHAPILWTTERYPLSNGATADATPPMPSGLPSGVLDGSDTLLAAGDWDNDGHADAIARDSAGVLYLFPGNGTRLGARLRIGLGGWSPYTIAGVADWDNDGNPDLLARNPAGELLLYPGQGTRSAPQAPVRIGSGFGGYTFAGVADWDNDGHTDLVARLDSTGLLYLFPGDGTRADRTTWARSYLGEGWTGFRYYGVADRTGDNKPDIYAVTDGDGKLWLYPGSGTRSPYTGTPFRHLIGNGGWQNATAAVIPTTTGDPAPDLIAHVPGQGNRWLLYPGVVGTGEGGAPTPTAGVGLADGVYAYRAAASDGTAWTTPSGWCEFAVDLTDPTAPAVTAQVYKPTGCPPEGCGSLGVADTFTFTSSPDVVSYRWGFTDPPSMTVLAPSMGAAVSVRWTPPSAGAKTLYVKAIDRAGRTSQRTYQFTVAGAVDHIGQWMFGDDPAYDVTGNGRDLVLTGVVPGLPSQTVGGEAAAGFAGTGFGVTPKLLDTTRGFSVSAWVKLAPGTTGSRTVISQQGTTTAAFRLGYDGVDGKWVFSRAEADTASPTYRTARSDAPVARGVWTHLIGTYDAFNSEVRLYVDGALQRTIDVATAGFDASGELWVGRRLLNGTPAEAWTGELLDVRAWDRTLTHPEAETLVDPEQASTVGKWEFNEIAGTTAHDTSRYVHDLALTLAPGASWGLGVQRGGLHLNGTGSANSGEQVLNTDQSFSVDVWARLAEAGAQRTIMVQRGPSGIDPFALRYDGGKWVAEMPNAPTNPTTWWRASSTADAAVNTWTHLTAAYDASTRTLRLWVNDVLQGTTTGVIGWNSTGVLSVGRGSAGAYWFGDIDELKVHQGVLEGAPLTTTAPTGASVSGDARAEIIRVDAGGEVWAFQNVNGSYPGAAQHIGWGWTPERTWFTDLDGDGRTEIIGLNTDGTIRAYPNVNGLNGFPFGTGILVGTASSTDPVRLRFADLDGDGRAERISLDPDGRVRAYRNLYGMNALGRSTAFATTPVIVAVTSHTPDRIRFADIDGDHRAEFITVNDDRTVSGYRNQAGLGYRTFDEPQEIGIDWEPARTRFADLTGDGRAEIIAVRPDGTVWSYLNINGLNGFPYGGSTQVGHGWHEPARAFFG
ncbi:LamG-like jellyroll fold domain-containing protein [Actinosynnema sp. NPDC059797]